MISTPVALTSNVYAHVVEQNIQVTDSSVRTNEPVMVWPPHPANSSAIARRQVVSRRMVGILRPFRVEQRLYLSAIVTITELSKVSGWKSAVTGFAPSATWNVR